MEIYNYLVISIFVLYFACLLSKKNGNKFFYTVIGLLLIMVLGLRNIDYCGIDLGRYYNQYETLARARSVVSSFEMRDGGNILFFITCYVFAKLGLSFQSFLFIAAVFSVSAAFYLYYKYSKYPLMCVCMFLPILYIHQFSQLKQSIATGFVILAYLAFRKNKTWAVIFLMIIAILYHPSAIVLVPLFVLSRYEANSIRIAILLAFSTIVFVFRMEIGMALTLVYDSDYLDHYESTGGITGMAIFFILITIIYIITMPRKKKVKPEEYLEKSGYLYVLIVSMSLFFCASYSYAFTRINFYYMSLLPLVLSSIADSPFWEKKMHTKIPSLLMVGVTIVVMINWFYKLIESQQLVDYQFFWMR